MRSEPLPPCKVKVFFFFSRLSNRRLRSPSDLLLVTPFTSCKYRYPRRPSHPRVSLLVGVRDSPRVRHVVGVPPTRQDGYPSDPHSRFVHLSPSLGSDPNRSDISLFLYPQLVSPHSLPSLLFLLPLHTLPVVLSVTFPFSSMFILLSSLSFPDPRHRPPTLVPQTPAPLPVARIVSQGPQTTSSKNFRRPLSPTKPLPLRLTTFYSTGLFTLSSIRSLLRTPVHGYRSHQCPFPFPVAP